MKEALGVMQGVWEWPDSGVSQLVWRRDGERKFRMWAREGFKWGTVTSKLNKEGNTDQGFSTTFKGRYSGSFHGRISGAEEAVARAGSLQRRRGAAWLLAQGSRAGERLAWRGKATRRKACLFNENSSGRGGGRWGMPRVPKLCENFK